MRKPGEKSKCRNVRGMLSEFLDGTINQEERSIVEKHLLMCPDCTEEFESLQMTVQMLHRMPAVPAPRSFAVKAVEKRRSSIFDPQNMRWLRPATAFVAIVLMVLLSVDFLVIGGGVPVDELQTPPVAVPSPGAQVTSGELRGDIAPEATPPAVPDVDVSGSIENGGVEKFGGSVPSEVQSVSEVKEGGWSAVRQAEVAVGVLVVVLLSVVLFTGWRRGVGWGQRSP